MLVCFFTCLLHSYKATPLDASHQEEQNEAHASRAALAVSVVASVLAMASKNASAEGFPDRQDSIIIPYPAGGFINVGTRILAEGLRERWGKSAIPVNRSAQTARSDK